MDVTTVIWICICGLVVFNSFVLFYNLRNMYQRNILDQLQEELSNAEPWLIEDSFSALVRFRQFILFFACFPMQLRRKWTMSAPGRNGEQSLVLNDDGELI